MQRLQAARGRSGSTGIPRDIATHSQGDIRTRLDDDAAGGDLTVHGNNAEGNPVQTIGPVRRSLLLAACAMRLLPRQRWQALAVAAGVCLVATSFVAGEPANVLCVVDGDTLLVRVGGTEERVQLIGVDTPETVHPHKPVQYFGKEASVFTRSLAEGKTVRMEYDSENKRRDYYGRLLRYVYLPDGRLLNAEIIAQGSGFASTRFPFLKMEEFRRLEREARENERELWADEKAEKRVP